MSLNEEMLHINVISSPKIELVPREQCYLTKKLVSFLKSKSILKLKLLFYYYEFAQMQKNGLLAEE